MWGRERKLDLPTGVNRMAASPPSSALMLCCITDFFFFLAAAPLRLDDLGCKNKVILAHSPTGQQVQKVNEPPPTELALPSFCFSHLDTT